MLQGTIQIQLQILVYHVLIANAILVILVPVTVIAAIAAMLPLVAIVLPALQTTIAANHQTQQNVIIVLGVMV